MKMKNFGNLRFYDDHQKDVCVWNATDCTNGDRSICNDIKATYSNIFAIFSVTASISGLVFEPVGRLTGPIGVRKVLKNLNFLSQLEGFILSKTIF